jgi:surfeit locus 1 family protein
MEQTKLRQFAGPGLLTLVMLALLLWLGTWQLQRRVWKAGLLADIDRGEQAPPIPLGATTPSRFTKVSATGVLEGKFALYGSDVRDVGPSTQIGAQLLEVLDRPGMAPVLVDLGWVRADYRDAVHPVTGPATVIGYIRAPEHPGWLSAADDVAGQHFYTLDPAVIASALGVSNAAPFTLVALGNAAGAGPVPADALPRPADNHLQYAITWFGMAATLLVIFAAWVRGKYLDR